MPDAATPATGAPAGEAGATGNPLVPAVAPDAVTITLDGRQVQAKKGEMLIAAAERAGTYIPRFCYHPRMKPVGMCRMCLVELKGPRGFSLTPACYVPVAEGMEVLTDSPKVKKAQDGVLEFLLVNHPLDCPVCDNIVPGVSWPPAQTTICVLGPSIPSSVASGIRMFRDEFLDHIRQGHCPFPPDRLQKSPAYA